MIKQPYTYKGQPIGSASPYTYRGGGVGSQKVKLFFAVAAILVLAFLGFFIWRWFFYSPSEKKNTPEEIANAAKDQLPESSLEEGSVIPSEPEQESDTVVKERSSVSLNVRNATAEQLEMSKRAGELLSEEKWEEARSLLQELFASLPTNTVLYEHAQKQLAEASDNLYQTGKLPPVYIDYTVGRRDTLSGIARANHSTTRMIMETNGLEDANHLRLGQKLRIPQKTWKATIYLDAKKMYVTESDKLIRIYSINVSDDTDAGGRSTGTISLSRDYSELKEFLKASDIKSVRDYIPVGSQLEIMR